VLQLDTAPWLAEASPSWAVDAVDAADNDAPDDAADKDAPDDAADNDAPDAAVLDADDDTHRLNRLPTRTLLQCRPRASSLLVAIVRQALALALAPDLELQLKPEHTN